MGYTTTFTVQFDFDKALDDATYNRLDLISRTRRVKRRGLGPEYGIEGEFYGDITIEDNIVYVSAAVVTFPQRQKIYGGYTCHAE